MRSYGENGEKLTFVTWTRGTWVFFGRVWDEKWDDVIERM